MTRLQSRPRFLALVFLVALELRCSSGNPGTGGQGGQAGSAAMTGGVAGAPTTTSGGAPTVTSGGAMASGGSALSSGGAAAGGAAVTSGGVATTSGGSAPTSGGAGTSGGVSAAGGASTGGASGGTAGSAQGGGSVSGGSKSSGGSAGTGGSVGKSSDLWISPDGVDTNPGSEAMPMKTLAAAHGKAMAGTTIWVKPGTYNVSTTIQLTKNGTEVAPIRVFAAPGTRPVFDFSGQPRGQSTARGVDLRGDYWHVKGIDFIKAGDNCIHVVGSHNTLEWLVTHHCEDTGIQIHVDSSLAGDATRGAHNTVLNCDSYENYDSTSGGENADGFAAKLYIGTGNVFRGCRAWNNSDDGWDLFAADDVVTIENSWAFANGKTAAGQSNPNGDGNGFKLGGAPAAGDANQGGAVHVVKGCFAFENNACGFVRNNNPEVPRLEMCSGRADPKGEFCQLTSSAGMTFTMTTAEAKVAPRNADGSLPAIH